MRALNQDPGGSEPRGCRVLHLARCSARPSAARRRDPNTPTCAQPFASAFSLLALGDLSRPKLDTLRCWCFFYYFFSFYSIPCNTGSFQHQAVGAEEEHEKMNDPGTQTQSSGSNVCASVCREAVTEDIVLLRRLWKKICK